MDNDDKLGKVADEIVGSKEAAALLRQLGSSAESVIISSIDGAVVMLATQMPAERVTELLCGALREIDQRRREQGLKLTRKPRDSVQTFALEFAGWQSSVSAAQVDPSMSRLSFYTGGLSMLKLLRTLLPWLDGEQSVRALLDEMQHYAQVLARKDADQIARKDADQTARKATAPPVPKGGGT